MSGFMIWIFPRFPPRPILQCCAKASEFQAIVVAQRGLCAACKRMRPLTVDHIIPQSKGSGHDASNIQALCQPCNSAKGDRDWIAFSQRIKRQTSLDD